MMKWCHLSILGLVPMLLLASPSLYAAQPKSCKSALTAQTIATLNAMAISPKGNRIALIESDPEAKQERNHLRLTDAKGELIQKMKSGLLAMTAVTFSANGEVLVYANLGRNLTFVQASDGAVLGRLHSEEEKPLVRAMKHGLKEIIKNLHFISPTELLVIGEYGGIEYVRFSTDSKPFAILNHTVLRGRGDREKAHAYLYLNKNLFLSGAGHYGVTHTEFTSSGGLKFTAFSRDPEDATGDIQTVTALESIDQGRWVMMGSRNGFIQIYDTSKLYLDGKSWRTKGEPILAWNARVRPSANEQFPVKMWDYMFGSPARRPDMVRHPIVQLMVFPEKNKVLAVSIDALDGIGYGYRALSGVRFTLFNFSSGALIRTWRTSTEMHELELHPMEVPVQRSPDGRQLFVGSLTADGKLTDIQTFDVESLLTDEPTKAVDFSKN